MKSNRGRQDTPALTPEAREKQLIAKAERLAEQKLEDGTASPQIIVHYLRLASSKEAIEKEILERKKELITAQTENLQSAAKLEAMFEEAVKVFREYKGEPNEEV